MIDRKSLHLKTHQQENLNFFRSKSRALSLLPFGAGKTPLAVLRIGDLVPPERALVVTTSGTIYKWIRDLKMWGDPAWNCVPFVGKNDRRVRDFHTPHNVAVINYEGLRVMLEALGEKFSKAYKVIILDEIHRLKNPHAAISKDAAFISHPDHANYVYGLTGSPILESPRDMFSIMRVINPWLFGQDYDAWLNRYFVKVAGEKEDGSKSFPKWEPRPGASQFLADKLHSISFHKEKGEVEVVYPKQVFRDPLVVELRGHGKRLYEDVEKRLMLALHHQTIGLAHVYPRLEKLCQLARSWCYDANMVPFIFPEAPAIEAFMQYMESIQRGARVGIWAVRPPEMSMLAHALTKMGRSYRIVHGGIRNVPKRDEITRMFNEGYVDCLIAHPRCIGEGIDLEANYSFRYSYRFSAQEWGQSIGRFARMTSSADWVDYRDLVVKDTIDEGIVASVCSKLEIGQNIIRSKSLPWRNPKGGLFDVETQRA